MKSEKTNSNNMENSTTVKGQLYKINPRNIVVMEGFNSRTDWGDINQLGEQIRLQGVLNPVSVIPFKDENGDDKYKLVDGERRYRSVMKLLDEGVEILRIPALFLSKSYSEEELLIQQALRNEGKPFNTYEWGVLARKLMDKCGLTITECAEKLGKPLSMLSRAVSYLELDTRITELLKDGTISGSNLERLLTAHNHNQEEVYNELIGLKGKAEGNGKSKISLRDLDSSSRTRTFKDSKVIMMGISKLFEYAGKATKRNNGKSVNIGLNVILAELQKGKLISEIFDEAMENVVRKTNKSKLENTI